ncbi:MAG: ABC transporter ATP-binding protein [Caldilineaceae bacterium]
MIDTFVGNSHLVTENLAIGYLHNRQQHIVADKIDVTLRAGELTCLIGPNGVGKSTLIRTLAGMQLPLAGQVYLGNANLHRLPPAELARRLAVVLTERVDVGNLSAYGLVALGRHPYTDWRGRLTTNDQQAVERALTQVKAMPLAHRSVNELSDGERQRVMIARALAQLTATSSTGNHHNGADSGAAGKVLILDEPTAFLDLPRRVEMMQLLGTLARTTHTAVLLSTHDLELALRVADRLWLLPSSGKLIQGLPEELVLNGALAATFQSEGVEFDPALGSFKLQRHPCGPISLHGSGLQAEWTQRALERVGFEVLHNDPSQPYQVSVENGWTVVTPSSKRSFTSLHEVVDFVKQ